MSYNREYYLKNKEKYKERDKKKYQANKEKILKRAKENYDPEKKSEYNKKYMMEHKEEIAEYNKKYYVENKKEIIEQHKIYTSENREKISKYLKEYNSDPENINRRKEKIKEKYDNNECFKFSLLFRNNLNSALKKGGYVKSKKSEEILGCSFINFIEYIQNKFEPWMTWENHGRYNGVDINYGWDIDHIIPVNSAKTEDDLIKLNHFTNLQPLCCYENRHLKRNKSSKEYLKEIKYNECLCCGNQLINKKYCDEKCKSKYYYHTKEGVKEYKINNVKENRIKNNKNVIK